MNPDGRPHNHIFWTISGADFARSIAWSRKQPNVVRQQIHEETLKRRPEIMTAAEKLINDVVLTPVPTSVETADLPHVTHEGVLKFCGHELRVYQLSTGQRVFDGKDVEKLFSPPQ